MSLYPGRDLVGGCLPGPLNFWQEEFHCLDTWGVTSVRPRPGFDESRGFYRLNAQFLCMRAAHTGNIF